MTKEEAIEVYNGLINTKIKEAFEFFAPELRESEDEKIRQGIVETIKQCTDILDPKNQKRMLDWLEKQKEHQNNSDAREKALGRDLTFPDYIDKNLDESAQDYVNGVKKYNPEPTWNLMQIELIQRSWYRKGYNDREFGKEPKWVIKTGDGGPKYEENPKYGQMLEAEQKPSEEQPEVELEKEYDEQFDSDPVYGQLVNRSAGIAIARHFYELGLNARNEHDKI